MLDRDLSAAILGNSGSVVVGDSLVAPLNLLNHDAENLQVISSTDSLIELKAVKVFKTLPTGVPISKPTGEVVGIISGYQNAES